MNSASQPHALLFAKPTTSPAAKQHAVRRYGAEVVLCAPDPAIIAATTQRYVDQYDAHYIHPSNDVDVMSGQGTAILELLDQTQADYSVELDAIIVPIGGGGLCSGTAIAAKARNASIKVFGAEPDAAVDMRESIKAKKLKAQPKPPQTVADGLRTTISESKGIERHPALVLMEHVLAGALPWPIIRDRVDDVAFVSEEQIVAAMKLVWERMKLVVEPSSTVALAALLSGKLPLDNNIKNVGIVFTGGNVDMDHLPWLAP